jgi:hypothetical protein
MVTQGVALGWYGARFWLYRGDGNADWARMLDSFPTHRCAMNGAPENVANVPQRLKPPSSFSGPGTAKAVPLSKTVNPKQDNEH